VLTDHTAAQLLALCCPQIDHKERLPFPTSSLFSIYNEGLYLVFSSAKDGFSLSSVYEHTKGLSPLVIVVKSVSPSSSTPMVIGAYSNEPMKANPSSKVRGNGNGFLFTLSDNTPNIKAQLAKKYLWAGLPPISSTQSPLYEVVSMPVNKGASRQGTLTQFSVFSNSFISFGGSDKHGTSAMRLDEDLSICHCGPSDTYGNNDFSILDRIRGGDCKVIIRLIVLLMMIYSQVL